jgi:hypothetical protein
LCRVHGGEPRSTVHTSERGDWWCADAPDAHPTADARPCRAGQEAPRMSEETLRAADRARSPSEKRRSFPKISPLPGGLYAERKRCNRPNCRCATGGDALHGPYLYRRWSELGRLRRQYVKAGDAERVRAGLAEWRRQHPPARSERELLANLRRLFRDIEAGED